MPAGSLTPCAVARRAVIEFMKEEAAKRSERRDAEDNDKRKWMSTAQLWVDSRATDAADPVVRTTSSLLSVFIYLFSLCLIFMQYD